MKQYPQKKLPSTMPDSLLVQWNCWAMLTEQMGMATRAQYSRQVPNSSTTVHVRARGLRRAQ